MKKLTDEERKKAEKKKRDSEKRELRLQHPWTIALKRYLKEQGHGSQTRLADRVIIPPSEEGLSQQYITRLANGDRGGTEAVRRKISELIGEDYEQQMALNPIMPIASKQAPSEAAGATIRPQGAPEYRANYVLDQIMDVRGKMGEFLARIEALEKRLG